MVLQDVVSLKWRVKGVIIEGRISEDGTVRSYLVKKENGKVTIRSARHIKLYNLYNLYNLYSLV